MRKEFGLFKLFLPMENQARKCAGEDQAWCYH